jgi:hypothetical protein
MSSAARRPSAFDDKRARIAALAAGPPALAVAELRRFLGDKTAYIVGDAAAAAQKLEFRELAPDMAAAFDRLLVDPLHTDKGCLGKARLVEALLALDADVPGVYLAGVRLVQEEPAYGGKVDVAAPIRGLSAQGLVQIDHQAALLEIAPLLVDREPVVRVEAARALGRSGIEAAGALLHLKVLTGDREPDVLQACYESLLRLLPGRYLRVVAAAFAGSDEAASEAAAVALGESRLADALPILERAIGAAEGSRDRQRVLTAIALHRSDAAIALLVSLVEKGPEPDAVAALGALGLHRHDPRVAERVRRTVEGRGSKRLAEALRERFGG